MKIKIESQKIIKAVKKLEKIGVIKNYYTVIDSFKLGYSCYRLYIKLQYATEKKKKEIIFFLLLFTVIDLASKS